MIAKLCRHAAPGALTLALVSALSSPAAAQSNNQMAAESLFREARRLLDEGKYAQACEKLAASERLDPAVGTLINLGRCYEKTGQVASAWARYREAASMAKSNGQTDRATSARQAADKLEPLLPHLTLQLPPTGAPDKVTMDGVVVGTDAMGVAVPVDPGTHKLEASGAGKQPYKSDFTIAQSESKSVTLPPLADATDVRVVPANPNTATGATIGQSGTVPEPIADNPPPGFWNTQRALGVVIGGVGVAGLVVSLVEGLAVVDKKNKAEDLCPGGDCKTVPDNAIYNGLIDDARTPRTVSIITGAAGGAALVGGIVLFATAGSGKSSTARLEVTPLGLSGLQLRGAF